MSVKAEELDNLERGIGLATRDVEEPRSRGDVATAELVAMQTRISVARTLAPAGSELHCRDCWTRGRDAALRMVVEGKKAP